MENYRENSIQEGQLNILLTSSGRRGYLVNYFRQALNGRGAVHAGNSVPNAPAFYYADQSVVTPLIYDENYIPFLLEYCKENAIKVVIPLFDVDLKILTRYKHLFAQNGVIVVVSDEEVIDICNDKWETYKFCTEKGYLCPKTYKAKEDVLADIEENRVAYPIMVKPRWGMGSIAVYEADNKEELYIFEKKVENEIIKTYLKYESAATTNECVIFQQKIKGQEYGLDVIHDLSGNHANTIVRKKIAMRSGETDAAMVVDRADIAMIGTNLGNELGHIGNLDVDIFVADNLIYILELNARFGGGYPFSHCAGINLPKAIVNWILGGTVSDELIVKKYNHFVQKDICMIDLSLNDSGGY